ncbi:GDSL esterase/lipase WDL1 isoform X3 [Cryptomeria japonica]|uniref:GDSL esterase/lipase WDL1 isoform X3 n=1 Tax=Cryptomeria japonica TaxID=3369 RepID=UPI0027DA0538|nr:GDSL esterase/lipase WDL1 isoform X3 [Cryptomeria japonica]
MAGHKRPQFVLFGASLTEYAFQPGGWGASLTDIYARKADVLLRGYNGWNTRRALAVLDEFFPKDAPVQPHLVVVCFGANDAAYPLPSGRGQHVPIHEYKSNLQQICLHIKGLSSTTRVVVITPPPIYEDVRRAYASDGMHLSPIGNQTLLEELLKVLRNANWVPSLYWENMPSDFNEPSIYDYVHPSQELCSHGIEENDREKNHDC